jgi:hypothetical protein
VSEAVPRPVVKEDAVDVAPGVEAGSRGWQWLGLVRLVVSDHCIDQYVGLDDMFHPRWRWINELPRSRGDFTEFGGWLVTKTQLCQHHIIDQSRCRFDEHPLLMTNTPERLHDGFYQSSPDALCCISFKVQIAL